MKAMENRERGGARQYQGAARMKGWQTKKLGDLVEVQNGYAFSSKDYSESGHFLMRIGNVQNGYIYTADPKFIKLPSDGSLRRFVLSEDDILVSLTGNVGRVGVIQESHLPAALNQRVARISIRKDSPATRELLLLFLCSDWFREELISAGHGAAQQNVSTKDLVEIEIPVPPLAEQQRIVGLLDEAFEGLATAKANAAKNLQNARALFESHLQSVFTHRGPGWVEKRLGELCERITKGSSPKWQGISYVDAPGILFVTSENVGEYDILLEQPKYVEEKFNAKDKKSILKNGDVLTNIVGASIGRTAVFDRDDVANINQAVCLIRCEPHLLNNYYLAYLLNSPVFKQVLHDNEVNNARANLSLGFFSQLPVPMPPIPKQKEIVAKLDAFREETQRLARLYERKHAALEALKKSLLHQAFTGAL